jgi:hypothetical protein
LTDRTKVDRSTMKTVLVAWRENLYYFSWNAANAHQKFYN